MNVGHRDENRGIYRPETSRSFGKVNPRKLHRISSHTTPVSPLVRCSSTALQSGHRDKKNKDKEMNRDSAERTSCVNATTRAGLRSGRLRLLS